MECPQCKQQNAEDAAFCNYCGHRFLLRCTACDMVNPLGSKFCSRCGADLSVQSGSVNEKAVDETPPSPTTLACPRCHSVNEPGSLFCYNCGLPLDDTEQKYLGDALGAFAKGRPAGFWIRVAATLIDGVLILTVTAVLAALIFGDNYFAGYISEDDSYTRSDGLFNILDIAYSTIAVGLLAGTAGKLMLRMQVIRVDGSRVGYGRAFVRYLATGLSVAILLIGVLMIAFRRDKRGLHDLICDTVVIIRH